MEDNWLEIMSDPLRWAETFLRDPKDKEKPLKFRSYQANVLNNTRKYKNMILRQGRRCLPDYSPILMYDGMIKKLKDVNIGDYVVARDDNAQPKKRKVIDKFSNGIKSVYKITFSDGREIDCTDNHPLLSWVPVDKGSKAYHYKWKSIEDGLNVGDKVIALKEWKYFGNISAIDEAKLFGYLVTDGHLGENQTPKFTSKTIEYINEVQELIYKLFGYQSVIKKREYSNCYDIHLTDGNKQTENLVKSYLYNMDILGTKAKYDGIIKRIQLYDAESLSLFLNRVYAGDGCVSLNIRKDRLEYGKAVEVNLTSHYVDFLKEIRSVLYKIGIRAKIKKEYKKSPSSDKMCTNYKLYFSDAESIEKFFEFVGPIYGKEEQSNEALIEIKKRSKKVHRKGSVHYYKSVIRSIELIGKMETYDITVEKNHNFTVNGIVTHNSGKSVTMCVDTFWWAAAYPYVKMYEDKSQKVKPIRIILATPYETQIKELWHVYMSLIADSPLMKTQIKKIRTSDVHIIEFENGSSIEGYTIGISSSNKGTSLRSLSADILFIDEMDFIPREIMEEVIIPIATTHTDCRMRICSTPSGKRELFYEWATRAEELGWFHQWIPAWHPDNDNWMSIEQAKEKGIPISESTEFQVRAVTSSERFNREYGADFGEELGGVYKHTLISKSLVKYGRDIKMEDTDIFDPRFKYNPENLYVMGVDWNSYRNGGQIVVMEYCRAHTVEQYYDDELCKDIEIDFTNKFRLFYRKGIKSKNSTQRMTREEIIRICKSFRIDYIYVDYGHGDTNIEELTFYGKKHPELGLEKKLRAIDSGAVTEHWDPVLRERVSKRNKSLMINFSVLNFEEGRFILPKEEDQKTRLIGQLRGYRIKNVTSRGDYSYEGEDHILDAFNLAIYGFSKEYDPGIFTNKQIYTIIRTVDPRMSEFPQRENTFDISKRQINSGRAIRDPEKPIQYVHKPIRINIPTRQQVSNNFRRTF